MPCSSILGCWFSMRVTMLHAVIHTQGTCIWERRKTTDAIKSLPGMRVVLWA